MSVTFADIRAMLKDRSAITWEYQKEFDKVMNDLGEQGCHFSDFDQKTLQQIAQLQNKPWPVITHPRTALYASAYHAQSDETIRIVKKLAQGDHAITRLCAINNADLRVYELDLEGIPVKTGMDEETAAHAISYGLMALDEHVDFLIIGSISAGLTEALEEIAAHLKGADPLMILARYAGHDICAVLGSVLAARMAKIPVLCDAPLYPVLSAIVSSLLPETETVLLAPPQTSLANDAVGSLYQLTLIRALAALGPQPVKNLTSISKAA
jgi:NaMN:DMB phosphoribosyltransferase